MGGVEADTEAVRLREGAHLGGWIAIHNRVRRNAQGFEVEVQRRTLPLMHLKIIQSDDSLILRPVGRPGLSKMALGALDIAIKGLLVRLRMKVGTL